MVNRVLAALGLLSLSIVLAACGGSSSPSPTSPAPSPTPLPSPSPTPAPSPSPTPMGTSQSLSKPAIEGLRFEAVTVSGETDTQGRFTQPENETVRFYIGDLDLGDSANPEPLSVFTLSDTAYLTQPALINRARLLYSLDIDDDPTNGIQIHEDAHTMAQGVSVDFSSPSFDDDVANLVANSGSSRGVLLSAEAVRDFLLDELDPNPACARTNSKVGLLAELETRAHGTEGRLRVVNDCTIAVTMFHYDGEGAGDVRFYDLDAGRSFGDNLSGMPYDNANFQFSLAESSLNTLERISLWCIPVGVSFGEGRFQ